MEVAVSTEKAPTQRLVGHIAPEGAEGNVCLMLSTESEKIPRGVYVRINDNHESFIARIVDGPFFGKDVTLSAYKLELTAMITLVARRVCPPFRGLGARLCCLTLKALRATSVR